MEESREMNIAFIQSFFLLLCSLCSQSRASSERAPLGKIFSVNLPSIHSSPFKEENEENIKFNVLEEKLVSCCSCEDRFYFNSLARLI